MKRAGAVLALVVFASCTVFVAQQVDTLYFGTNRPGGVVSDAEWKAFVDEVITPEFPGFTEWRATGHWKSQEEATHIVQIVHGGIADDAKIGRIVAEYKRRFQQESVFRVRAKGQVPPQ